MLRHLAKSASSIPLCGCRPTRDSMVDIIPTFPMVPARCPRPWLVHSLRSGYSPQCVLYHKYECGEDWCYRCRYASALVLRCCFTVRGTNPGGDVQWRSMPYMSKRQYKRFTNIYETRGGGTSAPVKGATEGRKDATSSFGTILCVVLYDSSRSPALFTATHNI